MSDANIRQIRVLHIVSAGALASSLQQSLFMPLLTRLPRPRVKSLVACLSPGAVPSAVLRQSGVPTYDLAISRKRFSPRAFQELQQVADNFRPDVIQAWGHTAQVISTLVRSRCDWKPKLIWNIADTAPLAKNAGLIDRQKLKHAAKFAKRADRIVYSSEAAASAHRRVGFPDGGHETVPPGVDATRFKPDFAARRKLREQLNLPGEAFVIGMYAPFQPEYDFPTLIKAVGELIKTNPNVALVLAGHGVQKGNAPLMGLIGGGALATRVHLLGEWSDISGLYNACDVVCSSALNDQSRMNLVMAMLCGVPCVATGMGAQGEVIGQHGVAIEPGSPTAFVKGITRVMQMAPEKRTFMAQGARKHALANFVYVRSLQKYLQLYYDLIGRQSLVAQDLPTPEVDPTLTVPPALPTEAELNAAKRKPPTVADWGDPDSLETKITEREPEELPKWRIEQEQERSKREAELAAKVAASKTSGDVLQVLEMKASAPGSATPMTERARGVADDVEDLLSPDLITVEVPVLPRMSTAPSGARKTSSASQAHTAKQSALKAAQRAALQPIASPPKRSASAKPATPAKTAEVVAAVAPSAMPSIDFNSTQPVDLLSPSELMRTSPAAVKAEKADRGAAPKIDSSPTQIVRALSAGERPLPALDDSITQPLQLLPQFDLSLPPQASTGATPAATPPEKTTASAAQPTELLPEIDLSLVLEKPAVPAQPAATLPKIEPSAIDAPAASPLGRLAKALASATVPPTPPAKASSAPSSSADAKSSAAPATASMTAALEKWNSSFDLGELSLMATGMWKAHSSADAKTETSTSKTDDELSGPETLSLISETASSEEPTLKLEALPESAAETRRAANGE